jgi:hypothetical protein
MQVSLADRVSVLKNVSSNLQIEIAFAGLASKLVVITSATIGWPQISDHFIVYPAARALEVISAHGHEATKALQRVICNMEASFYFNLCCLDCR